MSKARRSHFGYTEKCKLIERLHQLKRSLNALSAGRPFDHPEAVSARELGERANTLLKLLEGDTNPYLGLPTTRARSA